MHVVIMIVMMRMGGGVPVPRFMILVCSAGEERPQLSIEQPRSEDCDQPPARRFKPAFGELDLHTGCTQGHRENANDHDCRDRLHERCHERQQDAATHRALMGQSIG